MRERETTPGQWMRTVHPDDGMVVVTNDESGNLFEVHQAHKDTLPANDFINWHGGIGDFWLRGAGYRQAARRGRNVGAPASSLWTRRASAP